MVKLRPGFKPFYIRKDLQILILNTNRKACFENQAALLDLTLGRHLNKFSSICWANFTPHTVARINEIPQGSEGLQIDGWVGFTRSQRSFLYLIAFILLIFALP